MAKDLWKQLLDDAKAGRATEVELTPGSQLKPPKRKGRPRVRGATRFGHYSGHDPMKVRPRCRWRSCSVPLRRDQPIGCCEKHALWAIEEARKLLALAEEHGLSLSPADTQSQMGSSHGSHSAR